MNFINLQEETGYKKHWETMIENTSYRWKCSVVSLQLILWGLLVSSKSVLEPILIITCIL